MANRLNGFGASVRGCSTTQALLCWLTILLVFKGYTQGYTQGCLGLNQGLIEDMYLNASNLSYSTFQFLKLYDEDAYIYDLTSTQKI